MLEPLADAGSIFTLSLCVLLVPQLRILFLKKSVPFDSLEKKSHARISFFDFVRGIAIIAVIIIHSVWVLLLVRGADNLFVSDFVNMLARFAVPVFIIVSGMLLSIKSQTLSRTVIADFFLPKIKRIFIPYIVVAFILSMVNRDSIISFLRGLITGDISPPFYFVIILLQLYILYPFINRFRFSSFFLPVSFFISFISAVVPALWNIYDVPFFGQFLFFFCYGIARREEVFTRLSENKKYNLSEFFPWLMLFVGYVSFFIFSPLGYYYNGHIIYGVVVFNILLFKWFLVPHALQRFFSYIGRASLWIFLTHFIPTQFISLWVIETFPVFSIYFPIAIIVSVGVSVVLGIALERIYKHTFLLKDS